MQITITTYEELQGYIQLFKDNALEILIIEGSPGIGKSSIVKDVFKDIPQTEICYIEGRISAASFYEQLYLYRDCPIIIDDSGLYTDKTSITLLKSLCQTNTKDKKVSWSIKRKITLTSDTNVELPFSFYTGSTVCILCNEWKTLNTHISAIEDRGVVLSFHPDNTTLHQYASTIISDTEVLNFFHKYLHIIKILSIRQYKICQDIKHATQNTCINWQHIALGSWGLDPDIVLFIHIAEDNRFMSIHEKANEFAKRTNKSLRTYFRLKLELGL